MKPTTSALFVASTALAAVGPPSTGVAFTLRAQAFYDTSQPSVENYGLGLKQGGIVPDAVLSLGDNAVWVLNGTAADVAAGTASIVDTQSHGALWISRNVMVKEKPVRASPINADGSVGSDPSGRNKVVRAFLSPAEDPDSYLGPDQFFSIGSDQTRDLFNAKGVHMKDIDTSVTAIRLFPMCVDVAQGTLDGLTTLPVRCYRPGTEPNSYI